MGGFHHAGIVTSMFVLNAPSLWFQAEIDSTSTDVQACDIGHTVLAGCGQTKHPGRSNPSEFHHGVHSAGLHSDCSLHRNSSLPHLRLDTQCEGINLRFFPRDHDIHNNCRQVHIHLRLLPRRIHVLLTGVLEH